MKRQKSFGKTKELLGATIIIGKSAGLSDAPKSISFASDFKVITIGIGKDHTAELFIDKDSIEELRKFGEIIKR